jgi:hypothetical protein
LIENIYWWVDMQEELKHVSPPKCKNFQSDKEIPTDIVEIVDIKIANQPYGNDKIHTYIKITRIKGHKKN